MSIYLTIIWFVLKGAIIMKVSRIDIFLFAIQILIFYLLPLLGAAANEMIIMFAQISVTFLLSMLIGAMSDSRLKYILPVLTTLLYIPSAYIYENYNKVTYVLLYLIFSCVGLLVGLVTAKIINVISE